MRIKVTGPRGGGVDKQLEEYAKSAIEFFAKRLDIHAFKTTVHVKIHKKTYLDDADAEVNYHSKRSFVIDICLYNDWLTSLAHEMVHVKQVIRDELTHKILLHDINNHDEYRNVFYEKEAFEMQDALVDEYTKYRYDTH